MIATSGFPFTRGRGAGGVSESEDEQNAGNNNFSKMTSRRAQFRAVVALVALAVGKSETEQDLAGSERASRTGAQALGRFRRARANAVN